MMDEDQRKQAEEQVERQTDTQSDMRLVAAQQIQEAIHTAILGCFPEETEPDYSLITHCLGLTTAFFAIQAGIDELEFRRGMARYCCQTRQALGLEVIQDQEPSSPIILASS
jgi:hypothetical protein